MFLKHTSAKFIEWLLGKCIGVGKNYAWATKFPHVHWAEIPM